VSWSDDTYDRVLGKLLQEEARKLNRHLPRNRKSLKQLLGEGDPHVEDLDGEKIHFRRRDLEEAAKIVPEKYRASLMLPVVVVRMMGMGQGAFTVSGGRMEKFFVKKALSLTEKSFEEASGGEEVYLYKLQIQELISRLDSLVVIGFGAPEGPLRE
jgi:uncharacterized protein (UPF0216 family)